MKSQIHLVVIGVFLGLWVNCQVEAEGLGRGLGDDIDWKETLEIGLDEAKKTNTPLMLIIHKTWCGACKAFKPKFAASEEIQQLSKHFVMVNTQDDEEPKSPEFKPDGQYIPRILFLDSNGTVLTDIYNKAGNSNYKYFYPEIGTVIDSMKLALQTVAEIGKNEL